MEQKNYCTKILLAAVFTMMYASNLMSMTDKMRYIAAFGDISKNYEQLQAQQSMLEFEPRYNWTVPAPKATLLYGVNPISSQAVIAQSPYRFPVAYLLAQQKAAQNHQTDIFSRALLPQSVTSEKYSESFIPDAGLKLLTSKKINSSDPITQFDRLYNFSPKELERVESNIQKRCINKFAEGSLSIEKAIEEEKNKIHLIKQSAADLQRLSKYDIENIKISKKTLQWLESLEKEVKIELKEQERQIKQRAKLRAETVGVLKENFVPRLNIPRGDRAQLLDPYTPCNAKTPQQITAEIVTGTYCL